MESLGDIFGKYPIRRQPEDEAETLEQLALDRSQEVSRKIQRAGEEDSSSKRHAQHSQPRVSEQKNGEVVCPICRGAGYLRLDVQVGEPGFGEVIPCKCKEKEIKNKRRMELKELANLALHSSQTFQTFNRSVPGAQEAYEVAQSYANNPDGWLVLSGPVGCGKTHLAAAIAHTFLNRGRLVIFSPVPELLDYLRRTFAPSNELPYHDLFDRLQQAELLVLDDLGAERSTAWASEKLFQLIDYRYLVRVPTIITTNGPLRGEAKGLDLRIHSRLHDAGLVNWYNMKTPDYRPRNVRPKQPSRPQP
jgi:DNA replication protein DnaC